MDKEFQSSEYQAVPTQPAISWYVRLVLVFLLIQSVVFWVALSWVALLLYFCITVYAINVQGQNNP